MEKSIIEVFTSPTCPHCPSAINLTSQVKEEREDVELHIWSTSTEEGVERARQFNVFSVPTIFVRGPGHNEILAFKGAPSKERLNKAINITLGKEKL